METIKTRKLSILMFCKENMHLLEDIECNPRNEGSEKAAGDIRSALMMAGKSQGVSVKAASKGEPVAQATMPSAASVPAPAAASTEEASVVASRRSSSDGSVQEVSNLTVTAPPLKKRRVGRPTKAEVLLVGSATSAQLPKLAEASFLKTPFPSNPR